MVYTAPAVGDSGRVRGQKLKASSAARERLNARTSFQKLERVLAANFGDGDLLLTLTYSPEHLPAHREGAVKRLKSFLKALRALRKERGEATRYVYVTEGDRPGGRLHHHIVLNATGADLAELRRLWRWGESVDGKRLTFDQGHSYEDLASYLTKEPRRWGHPQVGERTWVPSLGLARPELTQEVVPDCLTLSPPPEAVILSREGPVVNGWGEFAWLKYLLPPGPGEQRPRARRKRPPDRHPEGRGQRGRQVSSQCK